MQRYVTGATIGRKVMTQYNGHQMLYYIMMSILKKLEYHLVAKLITY